MPVTGDIDPVAFLRPDGTHLTDDEYRMVLNELRKSGANIQHGAERRIVKDMEEYWASECAKLPPGSDCVPAGTPEWDKARHKIEDAMRELERNHLNGKETTIEFREDGWIYRAIIKELVQAEQEGGRFIDDLPVDVTEFKRILQNMTIDIRRDRLTTFDAIFSTLTDRRDTQLLASLKRMQQFAPDAGIDEVIFRESTPAEFVSLVDDAPQGLHVDSSDTSTGQSEGEGDVELTAQAILDKIREAIGEEDMANYRVEAKDNGGFVVYSQTARQRPYDVNGDGRASPVDALIIINSLNEKGTQQLPTWPSPEELRSDVSLDSFRSPLDALLIINFLNAVALTPLAEGEGATVKLAPLSLNSLQPMGYNNLALNNSAKLGIYGEHPTFESTVAPLWAGLADTTISANPRPFPARARELGLFEALDSILDDIVLGHAAGPLAGDYTDLAI